MTDAPSELAIGSARIAFTANVHKLSFRSYLLFDTSSIPHGFVVIQTTSNHYTHSFFDYLFENNHSTTVSPIKDRNAEDGRAYSRIW
jgi:hypothetical protein